MSNNNHNDLHPRLSHYRFDFLCFHCLNSWTEVLWLRSEHLSYLDRAVCGGCSRRTAICRVVSEFAEQILFSMILKVNIISIFL